MNFIFLCLRLVICIAFVILLFLVGPLITLVVMGVPFLAIWQTRSSPLAANTTSDIGGKSSSGGAINRGLVLFLLVTISIAFAAESYLLLLGQIIQQAKIDFKIPVHQFEIYGNYTKSFLGINLNVYSVYLASCITSGIFLFYWTGLLGRMRNALRVLNDKSLSRISLTLLAFGVVTFAIVYSMYNFDAAAELGNYSRGTRKIIIIAAFAIPILCLVFFLLGALLARVSRLKF